MDPFYALTGKKPRASYADIVNAEAPGARQSYNLERARKLEQEQFDKNYALQEDAMDEAQKQNMISTGVSTLGLGVQAAPYLKGAASSAAEGLTAATGAVKGLFAPAAEGVVLAEAAPAAVEGAAIGGELTAGLGAAEAAPAAESASAISGGGAGLGTAGWVLAAIAAQEMAAQGTDTEFEGQKTGSFFSTNDEGNWRPRFGNDPWKGFTNDKLGFGPTSGEKFDAAIANQDYGLAAQRLPAAAHQWADPIGDLGYDAAHEAVQGALGIHDQEADVAMSLIDPIGATVNIVEDSWLCTEVKKEIVFKFSDAKALLKLRKYSLQNHPDITKYYLDRGPELVSAIAEKEDHQEFYKELYRLVVMPIISLVKSGSLERAYELYKGVTLHLTGTYAPHVYPREV